MNCDVVVIGAGAAGLFCAAQAGKSGHKVIVLERNSQPGRKILVSGGGRCNFTNRHVSADNFVSENPHFVKSALAGYDQNDFIELVRSHRIDFYEKKLGQLFCRDSARRIVEMLLSQCERSRVAVRTNCDVRTVERSGDRFIVGTGDGAIECGSVVVATGGLSFPKIGATDLAFRIARSFGHRIVPTRPALVPLVFPDGEANPKLAGITIDAEVSIGKRSFRENILFTHVGLSGPAILQISNYWNRETTVAIDLAPGRDVERLLDKGSESKQLLSNYLSGFLPKRAADLFAAGDDRPLSQIGPRQRRAIAGRLHEWNVRFDRTEGYQKAEVTAGGVSTAELSSRTLESKLVPGLFFIGEAVDVTGWLGGYNFQWAWSSAYACGRTLNCEQ